MICSGSNSATSRRTISVRSEWLHLRSRTRGSCREADEVKVSLGDLARARLSREPTPERLAHCVGRLVLAERQRSRHRQEWSLLRRSEYDHRPEVEDRQVSPSNRQTSES